MSDPPFRKVCTAELLLGNDRTPFCGRCRRGFHLAGLEVPNRWTSARATRAIDRLVDLLTLGPDRCGHDCALSTALIVIDVQEEYLSGRLPIEFPPRESSLGLITTAIDHAAAHQEIHRRLAATLRQRAALAPLDLMGVEMASTAQWFQALVPESRSNI